MMKITINCKNEQLPLNTNKPLIGIQAIVDVHSNDGFNSTAIISKKLEEMGATVCKRFHNEITHVVWSNGKLSLKDRALKNKKCLLVSPLWIEECLRQHKRVKEKNFFPLNLNDNLSKQVKSMEPSRSDIFEHSRRKRKRSLDIAENHSKKAKLTGSSTLLDKRSSMRRRTIIGIGSQHNNECLWNNHGVTQSSNLSRICCPILKNTSCSRNLCASHWTCSACTFINESAFEKCQVCENTNRKVKENDQPSSIINSPGYFSSLLDEKKKRKTAKSLETVKSFSERKDKDHKSNYVQILRKSRNWICQQCTFLNTPTTTTCMMCEASPMDSDYDHNSSDEEALMISKIRISSTNRQCNRNASLGKKTSNKLLSKFTSVVEKDAIVDGELKFTQNAETKETSTTNDIPDIEPEIEPDYLTKATQLKQKQEILKVFLSGMDSDNLHIVRSGIKSINQQDTSRKVIICNQVTEPKITHVIVAALNKRTMKMIFGFLRNAFLVDLTWFYNSLEEGRWLEETKYKVDRWETLYEKKKKINNLFSKHRIYIGNNIDPPKTVMNILISLAGGQVVNHLDSASIVLSEDDNLCRRAIKLGIPMVRPKWLFDSICTWHLMDFEDYTEHIPL